MGEGLSWKGGEAGREKKLFFVPFLFAGRKIMLSLYACAWSIERVAVPPPLAAALHDTSHSSQPGT